MTKIVHRRYVQRNDWRGKKPKTVWSDSKYDASSNGIGILKDQFGREIPFTYPKSLYTVYDALEVAAKDGSIILDFFGGSGTSAEAVIKLNQNRKVRNKFLLVELGIHFSSALLPRTKKILFSDNWDNGKANEGIGYSGFFKYFKEVKSDFQIFGEVNKAWEDFEKEVDYESFLVKRKSK